MTGELDPWRLNLHTKMRSGGNGIWGRGPAQSKQSLIKKNKGKGPQPYITFLFLYVFFQLSAVTVARDGHELRKAAHMFGWREEDR